MRASSVPSQFFWFFEGKSWGDLKDEFLTLYVHLSIFQHIVFSCHSPHQCVLFLISVFFFLLVCSFLCGVSLALVVKSAYVSILAQESVSLDMF